MSTKTTFKRIALVTVAALGFGVLTSVSPANAAGNMELPTSIAAGTSESHRAGSMSYTPIVINLPSTAAETDTVVVAVSLLTAPATSTLASVSANPTQSAFTGVTNNAGANLTWALGTSGSGSQGSLGAQVHSTSGSATAVAMYTINAADSTGQITLRVGFKPDVAGTYTFLVSTPNALGDITGNIVANTSSGYYTASSADTSTAFSITTRATPTALTLAAVTTGAPSGTGEFGQIFRLTPSDGTANTLLGSTETITLSTGDSSVTFAATPDANPNTTASTLVVGRDTTGWVGGSFFFRVDNSSATSESVTITATGSGTLASSVSTSIGTTFTAVSATSVAFTSVDGTAGGLDLSAVATSGSTATAGDYTVVSGDSSHSLRATITTQAANVESWTITDTSRKITGYATAAAKYGRTITNAAADTNAFKDITVTATLGRPNGVADSFTATLNSLVARTITFTAAAAAKTAIVVTNPNRRVATGSANTFVAELDDQTGAGMANESITVTIAGRNGATASSTLVTNALGQVSYTLTDAGTVGTTDTITFTSGSATGSATLTYGTTTVTTLDILGPNDTAANTPDTNVTLSERTGISVAVAGASAAAGRATVTVTAKDALGVVMAGVPVTFTVAGTTAAILSTHQTRFTAADGTASTLVYAWATGSYVVTATAGGKTATSTVFFAQKDATAARTISAVVSGGTVTATVKDRYGNNVPNVTVWATKTGTGFFGSGSSSTSGTTSEAGTVDFYVNGSASVTLSLGSSTAADANYGQSGSLAGFVKQGDAGVSTAVTATTVGTATTAETGIGAAFAPAGINSVTVAVEAGVSEAQTAADAAAEATDAANAATDAANAAAEAADAATAAAQDAADAVAALSTQVTELVSALRKQITSLTNLVIKIQRKVRA
jgi:trimeric autotransporter adhesin